MVTTRGTPGADLLENQPTDTAASTERLESHREPHSSLFGSTPTGSGGQTRE